jgi:hypothetical protein
MKMEIKKELVYNSFKFANLGGNRKIYTKYMIKKKEKVKGVIHA